MDIKCIDFTYFTVGSPTKKSLEQVCSLKRSIFGPENFVFCVKKNKDNTHIQQMVLLCHIYVQKERDQIKL